MNNIRCRILFLVFFSLAFLVESTAEMRQPKSKQLLLAFVAKVIVDTDSQQTIALADQFLKEKPITVTSFTSARSAGGKHDFYSEATYWWPDPNNPNGPYIRKDGANNPNNFDFHRQASGLIGSPTEPNRRKDDKL